MSDDVAAIQNNPLLRSLAPANLAAIFSRFDDANYIPLKVLSLAIDQQLFGSQPFGYHLTNLLLHVVCALLLVRILRAAALSDAAAWLAALLWALHPLQVESVAFMSERKNVLSGALFLAAFLAYQRFAADRRWRAYAASLLFFSLALLAKMNTVVLPALVIAWDALVRRRLESRTWLAAAPMLGIGAVVVWINLAGNPSHGAWWHGGSATVTWLTSAMVPFRYLAAVVWPVELRYFYYLPLHGSPFDPPVALALLGLVALTALVAWLAWSGRREAFWLAWFGIALAPMLNVVPFPTLMQDRYMYLPSIGLAGALATALDRVRGRQARRALAGLSLASAATLAVVSVRQVEMWHDELSLWGGWARLDWYLPADAMPLRTRDGAAKLALLEAAAQAAPQSAVAQHNLGALLLEGGDTARGLERLQAAVQLDDEAGVPWLNLGRAYLRAGDPAQARVALEHAIASEPYAFYAHLNLARACLALADVACARAAIAACPRLRPGMERLWAAEAARLPP